MAAVAAVPTGACRRRDSWRLRWGSRYSRERARAMPQCRNAAPDAAGVSIGADARVLHATQSGWPRGCHVRVGEGVSGPFVILRQRAMAVCKSPALLALAHASAVGLGPLRPTAFWGASPKTAWPRQVGPLFPTLRQCAMPKVKYRVQVPCTEYRVPCMMQGSPTTLTRSLGRDLRYYGLLTSYHSMQVYPGRYLDILLSGTLLCIE